MGVPVGARVIDDVVVVAQVIGHHKGSGADLREGAAEPVGP
jgi:hypothetical protein